MQWRRRRYATTENKNIILFEIDEYSLVLVRGGEERKKCGMIKAL
jgi:hypothetical protein